MNKSNTAPLEVPAIPSSSYHKILHYLVLQRAQKNKTGSPSSFGNTRHLNFIFQYHKNFQLVSRLKGNALALLQTQFIKKPKNPV